MYNILLIIFCIIVYPVFHTYIIYPAWLLLTTSATKRGAIEKFTTALELPTVAIIMAAYNEDKVIAEKIASVFNTSYPKEKITFYIGSDASTDSTDSIIEEWHKKYSQIKLSRFAGRTGKSGIINELAKHAVEEIFILTDANVIFDHDTIFNLVRHFREASVAQVCANIKKVSGTDKGIAAQEKSYLALENRIKYSESVRWNIVMGAEGGCYAIRRVNFAPVPPKFYMDDFYVTLNVIEQGKQIVFDTDAICYEDVSTQSAEEYKRKVRISIGNFQNLMRYKKLLLPPWKGSAFAFWSHKVFRWLTPFLLIFTFILSGILAIHSKFFLVLFLLQLLGFLSPLFDKLFANFKLLRFISHFYLMNLALLNGFIVYVKGVESNVWQPTKRELN